MKDFVELELPVADGHYEITDPTRENRVIIDVRDGRVKIARSDLGTVLKTYPEGREITRPNRSTTGPTAVQE